MSLGYDREQRIVSLGDSAELYAYIYDVNDSPEDPDNIYSAEFTVQKPDGSQDTFDGVMQDDGAAYLNYTDTDISGDYVVNAQFSLTDGVLKSVRTDFNVDDPFSPKESAAQLVTYDPTDPEWPDHFIATRVWQKMEDLFDSHDGGPWMRDMTLNVFSAEKIPEFIDEALFDINVYNPQTDFAIDKFTLPLIMTGMPTRANANATLLIQGTWLAVIRHLMRTYVEQPVPMGGQVTYEDRRDYLQRWGTIYQIEFQFFDHLVKMWKRSFLGLGSSSNLVSSKAGRLLPAPLRSRNIGRGYY